MDIFNNANKLGFGLMRLPLTDENDSGSIDTDTLNKMVDYFIENGFTYFDTAWMYCNFKSEEAAKTCLVSRYPRDKFTLATKIHSGFIKTREDCDKVFNEQCRKTGAEYFDYYLIHDVNVHSLEVYDKVDIFSWLKNKKNEGLVKHMGFSFHDTPELLDKVLQEHPEVEFVQIQLNYLDYESAGIRSRECLEVCQKYNKPVIVMEPVKGGTLVNLSENEVKLFKDYNKSASIASWAVRFAASQKNVKMVLSGMSNMEQMIDNTSYMKDFVPLNDREYEIIQKVVDSLNSEIAIPCTDCEYCLSVCPKNIAIPKYFSLYNAEMKEDPEGKKGWTPQGEYYENLNKDFGKASDCIKCRKCEKICPQHILITSNLEKVAGRFE